jgi:hypothetical protein
MQVVSMELYLPWAVVEPIPSQRDCDNKSAVPKWSNLS